MSISIGGRAQTGPMQTVGGVKGSRLYDSAFMRDWPTIYANELAKDESLADPIFDSWSTLATQRFGITVNGMNAYRRGDKTETPLHFMYESSDCRMFWSPEMFPDQTALWNRVAEIAFDGRKDNVFTSKYCVEGSTKNPTSFSGGLKQGEIGPQTPPKEAFPRYSGWIINGTTITEDLLPKHDSFGPGTLSDGSSSESSETTVNAAALKSFKDYCAAYTGDAWLLKLMCKAVK